MDFKSVRELFALADVEAADLGIAGGSRSVFSMDSLTPGSSGWQLCGNVLWASRPRAEATV